MGKFLALAEDKLATLMFMSKRKTSKGNGFIRHSLFQFSVVKENGST